MARPDVYIEAAVQDSFYVERLMNAVFDDGVACRLRYHRLLLVEEGQGCIHIDSQSYPVAGGSLFLLSLGQLYLFDRPTMISGYTLSFGDCFWERSPQSASNCKAVLFNNISANQKLLLAADEQAEFSFLFKALLEEFNRSAYINQLDALAAYLKILMIKIANVKLIDESAFDSQDYVLYRRFMELVSSRFSSVREVSDYAKMLHVTARRLSDVCRRCSSRSAKEIINGQLMAEAKRALQFTAGSVKEIAYQLSFYSPEQFSHFFKKYAGESPSAYREQFVRLGSGE